ncbi:hypothetical protein GCM10027168_33050 [Streptomyces capparidis]|jgi:hypothetical protein
MLDGNRPPADGKIGKAVGVRLFVYLVAGHFVAFFFWLLFELGS